MKVSDKHKQSAISEALSQLNEVESMLRYLRKGIIGENQLACLSVKKLGEFMDKNWEKSSKDYFKEITGIEWDGR